jgi:gliding motility-associated-like protein
MLKFYRLLVFVFMSITLTGSAQTNLIYNGDFELYDTCPTNFSAPWDYQIEHCLGWTAPTYGTSDFYNSCSNSPLVGIPSNGFGNQFAYSGNGYCGFYSYSITGGGNYPGIMWWEYVQGKFTQPLETGHIYHISFYVSLAEYSKYAISQIGAHISVNSISGSTTQPLNVIPQIESPAGFYLMDSLGWTLIEGFYLAQGGERYITFGNFRDSSTTDTIITNNIFSNDPVSYYFIDGCRFQDVTDSLIITVFTPNGDGVNDVYTLPLAPGDELQIYNRWGNSVAKITSDNPFWDGTNNGSPCVPGVYFFVWLRKSDEKPIALQKGFFHLFR